MSITHSKELSITYKNTESVNKMKLTAHVEILPDFLEVLNGNLVPYVQSNISETLIKKGSGTLFPLIKRRTLKTLGRPVENFSLTIFMYSVKDVEEMELLIEQGELHKTPEGLKILKILRGSKCL